jgi:hypothetical protein
MRLQIVMQILKGQHAIKTQTIVYISEMTDLDLRCITQGTNLHQRVTQLQMLVKIN